MATVPADGERVVETQRFLEAVGAAASFRMHVVLSSGNERASGTVTLQREP